MSRPPEPATQREKINQLWFAVLGANSEGIAERVRRIDDRLQAVENRIPELMTHDQHSEWIAGCQEKEDRERRHKWRRTDVIFAAGMLIIAAISLLELVL